MPLPLSIWYALRTGHVARGVSEAGEGISVHAHSDPEGRARYEVARSPDPLSDPRCAATALGNHSAVFYGDGSLCDFLYTNGLDPSRLAVGKRQSGPAPPNAALRGPLPTTSTQTP